MYSDRDYYRPVGFGGFSFFPPVIKNLLLLNAVIYFLQYISEFIVMDGRILASVIMQYFSLIPIEGLGDIHFYPWQLITYQFMHGSFSHLFFNMLMLWMFGMEIENIWGSKKFLGYYLLCGIGAGLSHIFFSPILTGVLAPTVGASGSIFGVMIAFAMFFPNRYLFIYFLIPIKAKYFIAIMIVFEYLSISGQSVVAHLAHLGGALVGFLYIMIDRSNNISFSKLLSSFKKQSSRPTYQYRRRPADHSSGIEDADYYELNKDKRDEKSEVTQEEIDAILDKISKSGYQNLSDKEKKILFEASKRS